MLPASPSGPQSSHLSGLPGNAFLVKQFVLFPSSFIVRKFTKSESLAL
jgi:hypothetical protein